MPSSDRYYGRDNIQRTLLEVYAERQREVHRALIGKRICRSTVAKFERPSTDCGVHTFQLSPRLFLNELVGRFVLLTLMMAENFGRLQEQFGIGNI